MSNAFLMARHALGLGTLGDNWDVGGNADFSSLTSRSSGGFDWSRLIEPISNFGQTFLQSKYAKDAAKFGAGAYVQQQQGQGMTPEEVAALVRAQQEAAAKADSSIGIKFTDKGLQLGSSTLTWPVMGLGLAAFFLIQHSGFQKRGYR